MNFEVFKHLVKTPFTLVIVIVSVAASLLLFQTPKTMVWAVQDERVWNGDVWLLLTSCFLHGDYIHLFFNIWWVATLGFYLERWLGAPRLALLFLATALFSSAAQFIVSDGGTSIGLSGVVYGYFGMLVGARNTPRRVHVRPTGEMIRWMVGWFLFCIVMTHFANWRIANTAHGAGGVIGYLIGAATDPRRRTRLLMGGLAVVILATTAAAWYMPWSASYWAHRAAWLAEHKDLDGSARAYRRAYAIDPKRFPFAPEIYESMIQIGLRP